MEFSGRIPITINSAAIPSAKNMSWSETTPGKIHKLANGGTARSSGTPEHQFQFTFGVEVGTQAILAAIKDAKAKGEIKVGFTLGTQEFMLTNCGITSRGTTSDQDGASDFTMSVISGEILEL